MHSYIHLHLFFIFSTHGFQDNSEDNNAYNGSRDTYDQNYESSGHESVALNSRSDKGIEEGNTFMATWFIVLIIGITAATVSIVVFRVVLKSVS